VWRFDVPGKFAFSGYHFACYACTYHPVIYASRSPEASGSAKATGSSLYTIGSNTGSTAEASTCTSGTTAAICAAQTTGAADDAETNGDYDTGVS
jgi:hypothetical protein